ncbi:hypothetical protein CVT26_000643 [Gymnopilus dilepis]|uniref:DUF6533 domain-containing protein n=1 Tax=Gymnopilus dilepis TaxID=231916 RepID=A0A409Y2M3_9AGAR|nr:hypothetical protein CVT26_000643 [Gymnopilus dilepis]
MAPSSTDESLLRSLVVRQSSTVATWALLLFEHLLTCRMELRYIWRRPFKLNQGVYLFSRYLGIIVQSVNLYLALGPHSTPTVTEHSCKRWQLFQALASYALSGALHLILMLSVYALYFKHLGVGIYLAILFFGQCATQAFVTPNALLRVSYDPVCNSVGVHRDSMYLGISTWLTYISLVALAAAKHNLLRLGAPVVKLVLRDGAWTVLLLCTLFTAMLSYSWAHQVVHGHFIFGWANTILSIVCCRVIMNMESLDFSKTPSNPSSTGVDFNSADNIVLARLERQRRQAEGGERESSSAAISQEPT